MVTGLTRAINLIAFDNGLIMPFKIEFVHQGSGTPAQIRQTYLINKAASGLAALPLRRLCCWQGNALGVLARRQQRPLLPHSLILIFDHSTEISRDFFKVAAIKGTIQATFNLLKSDTPKSPHKQR